MADALCGERVLWHGDNQSLIINAGKLQNVVARISRGTIKRTDGISAIQAAKNWVMLHIIAPIKTVIGDVTVNANSVQDSLSHTMYQNKLDAVQAIEDVLTKGVFLGQARDWSDKPVENFYFAGKVDFDGEEKIVFIRTRRHLTGPNKFYVHEVFTEDEIKKAGAMQTGATHKGSRAGNAPDLYESLIAEVLNVNSHEWHFRNANPEMYAAKAAFPCGSRLLRPQDRAAMISIFKGKGDISTLVHEGAGHLFLENLREAAQQENAPDWVKQTWETIATDIGADLDPTKYIGTESHEAFAAKAVEYFRLGKAPSQELGSVFRMFARWLAAIYRQVRRMLDFGDVSPELEAAMDRLIATEEDIAKADKTLEAAQEATRRDNWRQWTEKYRFEMQEAGFTKLQADSFGDVLAAHAEVFAPMFDQTPQQYLEQRLGRIEQVTPTSYEQNAKRFLAGIAWNTQEERLQAD